MRIRQRMPWRKVGHDLWTDEVAQVLSGLALSLRIMLEARANTDDGQLVGGVEAPGVGWLLAEDGRPSSVRRIAAVSKFPEDDVVRALAELAEEGVAVVSDAGAWGTRGWAGRQETESAERMRQARARKPNTDAPPRTSDEQPANSSEDVRGSSVDREEERDEEQEQDQTHTPRAATPPVSVAPVLALVEPPPARAPATRRRATAGRPDVDRALACYRALRADLGLGDSGAPLESQAKLVTQGAAAAGGLEQLLTVLRRAAEDQRRQAEREGTAITEGDAVRVSQASAAKYFRLTTLCRPATVVRYLEQPELDHRRPAASARASPRGRGPAPPQNDDALPERIRE